ncbi:MAG: DMT family transporter [Rhodobacteraceae bacterium]|nr:DMT family transporter [Paracoccaceae bacterium]
MTGSNHRLGIAFMTAASLIFAFQDGISKYLSVTYNPMMVVLIRYWFFAIFVLAVSASKRGGIRAVARTSQPILQMFRGALLATEMIVMMWAIVRVGLVDAHALFACHPLLVAALSGVVLGESVGWRRWVAILVGFAGMLVIVQPGAAVFSPWSLAAFLSAGMFALYSLLTRYAARRDSAETSFFWTGIGGTLTATIACIWFWQPMSGSDWLWMALLCLTGSAGHFCLIKCYEASEASVVQPFAYFHLVFASAIGLTVFGEELATHVVSGSVLIVLAGLFTLWRQRVTTGTVSRSRDHRKFE